MALLLGALVSAGQAEHALWLLRDALAAGYELPAPAWNSALQLLVGRADWRRALALRRAMQLAHVRPDATTAALLGQAARRSGDAALEEQLACELAAQGLLQQQDSGGGDAAEGPAPGGGSDPSMQQQTALPLLLPLPNGGVGRSSSASAASIASSSNGSRLDGAPGLPN